jgi:hypothetical protein
MQLPEPTGATATLNSTCCCCGHDPAGSGADWTRCSSCGKVYCTDCVDGRRGRHDGLLCPCCGTRELNAAD